VQHRQGQADWTTGGRGRRYLALLPTDSPTPPGALGKSRREGPVMMLLVATWAGVRQGGE
jgi:hypothetical protein